MLQINKLPLKTKDGLKRLLELHVVQQVCPSSASEFKLSSSDHTFK